MTTELDGLHLFKSLIKDGCEWQGDVFSRKWSECLYVREGSEDAVERTLAAYQEGVDYRREGVAIWIV